MAQTFSQFSHFHVSAFNSLIQRHGVRCAVFPVMLCPCRTATLEPDPLCATCRGTTRYYPEALQFGCTLVLQQEASKRRDFDPGLWQEGTILASVPAGTDINTNDKIRVVSGKMTFAELCVKALDDTLRFTAGVELLAVADRAHGLYVLGQDYTLAPPNVVQWLGREAPAGGGQYSVRYRAFPDYLCVNDTPRMRIEYDIEQVREVRLMLMDKAMVGL